MQVDVPRNAMEGGGDQHLHVSALGCGGERANRPFKPLRKRAGAQRSRDIHLGEAVVHVESHPHVEHQVADMHVRARLLHAEGRLDEVRGVKVLLERLHKEV